MEELRTNPQDSSLLARRRLTNPQDSNLLARHRPASLPRRATGNSPGIGLSTRVTQTNKIVNAIYHLINKDWGKKTSQTISSSRKLWTVYRIDNSYYVPASLQDFYAFLHVLELTQVSGKDFSFTQIIIPGYHSKSTSAIKVTNAMPVSAAHGILDGFIAEILSQINNEVSKDVEKWSFRNKDGKDIHLKPRMCGPGGLSIRIPGRSNASTKEYDMGLCISWKEADSKSWPFWIHETAVSETWQHVFDKACDYVNGTKYHVSFISILNLEEHNSSKQSKDYRVDLSIWRITREKQQHSVSHKPKMNPLLSQIEVYPNRPDTLPTVTFSKHDLVSWRRDQDESLLGITMEIKLDDVYNFAEDAVDAMQTKDKHLSSSLPDQEQLLPSSPPGGSRDDEEIYQDEEGSEKGASQPQPMLLRTRQEGRDDPSNPIDNNSQDDTEEESGSKDMSGGSGFEEDDGSDSNNTSDLVFKQRTEDEEEEDPGISRLGDAGRANPSSK
ncbi:MAG: hypothetical protein Q9175_008264 [Cornicularia normoerica]